MNLITNNFRTDLPIYKKNSACPKCGCNTPETQFVSGKKEISYDGIGTIKQEHMWRYCTNCKFTWPEVPLDNIKPYHNIVNSVCENCGKSLKDILGESSGV